MFEFFKKKEEIKPVEKKFEIVSLGVNCLQRTLLTKKHKEALLREALKISHFRQND